MRRSVMAEWVIGLAALGWVAACGQDSETGGTTSTSGAGGGSSSSTSSGSGGQGGSSTSSSGFDPEDPGIHAFFELGSALMMGQSVEFAIAGFMPAAREDFEDPPAAPEIPIDTCQVHQEQAPTPTCTTDEDCAPEQDCLPETDNGSPIPGSEHCVTPRELMDVGPMTVTGFTSGPTDLVYNPGQSGAYTVSGTDGTLPSGTLAYDTTYGLSGDGDPNQGLGAFSGQVDLPPALTFTAPPLIDLGMPGVVGIEVDPANDLVLEWSGSTGGELFLNMASTNAAIDCRIADDGSFTIPAAMVQAVGLGEMAFFNILSLDRRGTGSVSGEGITYHEVGVIQTLVLNVGLAP